MLVPAGEAANKICPMRQATSIAMESETERPYLVHEYAFCLGPQCMAWRWFQEVGLCDGDTDNAIGFCGLADRIERGIE